MTDVILQGPGAFDHSTLDPDLAEEARATAGRKNADFGHLSFDISNDLCDLVFGIAAPSTQQPLSGIDFAICGACAADRAALMAQADSPSRPVTSRRSGTSPTERKRQQRARDRQQLVYVTSDWQLFTDSATLPQKAGCQPHHIRQIVLKELVDNALDAGADVTLDRDGDTWVVSDDGPGIDPADVPKLYAVNRPLLSSKLRRLPLRGMLGNGLRVVVGAIVAYHGSLVVETRGRRMTLSICSSTGVTAVTTDEPVPDVPGTVVRLGGRGWGGPETAFLARGSMALAQGAKTYTGVSSPWWYGAKDLHRLFASVTPEETTVGCVCNSLGLKYDDERIARSLTPAEAAAVLDELRLKYEPVRPEDLGFLGEDANLTRGGHDRTLTVTCSKWG